MRPPLAITRQVSSALAACELTHQPRVPIDIELARAQHRAYEQTLANAGYLVDCLPAGDDMPDAVFIEDTAVVLDELAIILRPGAESRRPEIPAVRDALRRWRRLESIEPPGTADGGDVLVAGRRVFVGRSSRTNLEAIHQLRRVLAPYGYTICVVEVRRCLHLKSAVTLVGDRQLVINPEWVDPAAFNGFTLIPVDPSEPSAANALALADRVIFPSAFPRTAERLGGQGLRVQPVDMSELAKAEGAVTCCGLLVP